MIYDLWFGRPCADFPNKTYEIFVDSFDSEKEIKKAILYPPAILRQHHALLIARTREESEEINPSHPCPFFSIVDTHDTAIRRGRKDILFFDGTSFRSLKKPDQRVEWDEAGFLTSQEINPSWNPWRTPKEQYHEMGTQSWIIFLQRIKGPEFLLQRYLMLMHEVGMKPGAIQKAQEIIRGTVKSDAGLGSFLYDLYHFSSTKFNFRFYQSVIGLTRDCPKNHDQCALLLQKLFVQQITLADFLIYCYSASELLPRKQR